MTYKLTTFVIAICLAFAVWYSWPLAELHCTDSLTPPAPAALATGALATGGTREVRRKPVASEVVSDANSASALTIRLKGLRPEGTVRLALFDQSPGFPQPDRARRRFALEVADTVAELVIQDPPEGIVAVAAFQDLNRDGVLNKGAYGVPIEPYGFSNNARGPFGPPSFESASVRLPAQSQELQIILR